MSLNRITLQGRLVADPEMRYTQSGIAVASFRLAVDRDYKDKEIGERKADFFNVTAWRGTADFVCKYFHKGDQTVVDGKLQNSEYTDKDGNTRVSAQVILDSIYFCGGGKKDGGAERTHGAGAANNYAPPNVSAEGFKDITDEEDGDTLPF